jgi:hypothetical protein
LRPRPGRNSRRLRAPRTSLERGQGCSGRLNVIGHTVVTKEPSQRVVLDRLAEILADPAALRGLAESREAEQAGDVVYGTEAARALLAERKR